MKIRTQTAIALLAVFAVPTPATAQEIIPGQRIRATMTDGSYVIGMTIAVTPDSIALSPDVQASGSAGIAGVTVNIAQERVILPRSSIAAVDRSMGLGHGAKKGAMYGAGAGGLLGTIYAASIGGHYPTLIVSSAAAFAASGALIGFLWVRNEKWQPIVGSVPGVDGTYSVGLRIPVSW